MTRFLILPAALLLASPAAFAHNPGDAGLSSGLAHALSGADHLLAMLVLGLWAAGLGHRQQGLVSMVMPAAMLAGLGTGMLMNVQALAETGIGLSLLLTAVLLASRSLQVISHKGAAVIAAMLVFAHGAAHTEVLSGTDSAAAIAAFATGMLITSTGLQQLGRLFGQQLHQHLPRAVQAIAAMTGLTGLVMLAS